MVRILLAVLILFTGNFSYALAHLDCVSEESMHHKCSSGCCDLNDGCIESENVLITKITKNKTCCDIHESTAVEQDNLFPAINKTIEKTKLEINFIKQNVISPEAVGFSDVTHNLKSPNIYLSVSSLRI